MLELQPKPDFKGYIWRETYQPRNLQNTVLYSISPDVSLSICDRKSFQTVQKCGWR